MKHYIYSLQKAQLLFALAFCIFLAMPCKMHAEEVEIPLIEVSGIGFIPGDDPLDGPEQSVPEPPQPTEFRASIDGSTLAITSGTHSARELLYATIPAYRFLTGSSSAARWSSSLLQAHTPSRSKVAHLPSLVCLTRNKLNTSRVAC